MADGKKACRIQADDPVCLASAASGRVQRVEFRERPEAAKGVANRRLGERAEPEPTRRLSGAPDQVLNVAKDQLAFTAGIGGANQLVRRAEEPAHDRKLLAQSRLGDRLEPEPLRNKRKRCQCPLFQRRIVILWLHERDQVPEGPRHLVALSLVVAIATRSQHPGTTRARAQPTVSRPSRLSCDSNPGACRLRVLADRRRSMPQS